MSIQTTLKNPLLNIKDQHWIKLVDLLTENVWALNSRTLSKIETLYTDGAHYPALYFRLTTILEDPSDKNLTSETSGFVFGLNNDWDDDVYIHPLSPQGYRAKWLKDSGITSFLPTMVPMAAFASSCSVSALLSALLLMTVTVCPYLTNSCVSGLPIWPIEPVIVMFMFFVFDHTKVQ